MTWYDMYDRYDTYDMYDTYVIGHNPDRSPLLRELCPHNGHTFVYVFNVFVVVAACWYQSSYTDLRRPSWCF